MMVSWETRERTPAQPTADSAEDVLLRAMAEARERAAKQQAAEMTARLADRERE